MLFARSCHGGYYRWTGNKTLLREANSGTGGMRCNEIMWSSAEAEDGYLNVAKLSLVSCGCVDLLASTDMGLVFGG